MLGYENEALGVLATFLFLFFLAFYLCRPKKIFFYIVLLDLIIGTLFLPPVYNIPNRIYHHDLAKKFKGKLWWHVTYEVRTNSLGFKDNSKRLVPPVTDKYRILFIGDSFIEGVGYPYDETFVGIIDRELGRQKFNVLNAGVGSYSPKLYYLKIKYLIERVGLKFNELFVYIDMSDIHDDMTYERTFPYKNKAPFSLIMGHCFLKKHSLIYRAYNSLLYRKRVLYNLFNGKSAGNNIENSGFAISEKYMDDLYKLCKAHNIKITIAIYPYSDMRYGREAQSEYALFWRKFCMVKGIALIDYFPDFFNGSDPENSIKKYTMENDPHWNRNGHMLVAEKWLSQFTANQIKK